MGMDNNRGRSYSSCLLFAMKLSPLVVLTLLAALVRGGELVAQPAPRRTLETLARDHEQRLRKTRSQEQFKAALARHAEDLEEYAKLRRKMGDAAGAAELEARVKAIRDE